jgi:D-sedoheptulose 7-phosphate isomerase
MQVLDPRSKICSAQELRQRCAAWREEGKRIVTTNGAFDLLHTGHIHSISDAAALGDVLIIGINSDASIKRYKAVNRPFVPQDQRAFQLACLPWVDAVHIFDEDTPDRFIRDVVPAVHCKGAHYRSPIVEEATVKAVGGRVEFLPIVPGHSTTVLSEKIFESQLSMLGPHKEVIKTVTAALREGNMIFFCGNGGSAASSQHFSAEFVGRFKLERKSLPAISLTVDTSILTSVANDYGYDQVFSRQIEGLARPGDVLFCLSTSGGSPNVLKALEMATIKGMKTVAIVGMKNPVISDRSDYPIVIPTTETTIIQEMTDHLLHRLCEEVELALCFKQ